MNCPMETSRKNRGVPAKTTLKKYGTRKAPEMREIYSYKITFRFRFAEYGCLMLTSTVLVAQIREAPDVAQSDARSANREKKVEARRPRIALLETVRRRLYCKDRIK